MSKIIVDQIESNNENNLTLKGNVEITGNLNANTVNYFDSSVLKPSQVHIITYGATAPNGLSVNGFGQIKRRGNNSYEFGINFGTTGAAPPTDWSSLTGWVVDPYGSFGPSPYPGNGINTQFRDALAQFRADFLMYPKGNMSPYWSWSDNDFVSESEFTYPYMAQYNGTNTLLPDEYNSATTGYKEVKPAAHIDNFAGWFSSLKSVGGVGNKMYLFGNLYLETGVNTSNPNLTDENIKNEALSYKNRQTPLNVTYIELGHEYYLQGSSAPDIAPNGGYAKRFPNGSDYADTYLRYLSQIRTETQLNNVYCAANLCTSISPGSVNAVRRNFWNESFINEYYTHQIYLSDTNLYKLNAISIHGFYKIGLNSGSYNNFTNWILTAADQHYFTLRTTIDDCKGFINSISSQSLPTGPLFMPKFWAIGYNLDDQEFISNASLAISGCWGHGLFNLHYQFRLMSDPDISVTAFHSSHGGRQYGLFFTIVNGWGTNTTDIYDLTATGYMFQILRQAEKNTSTMRPLSVAGANQSFTQTLGIYGMIFNADFTNIAPKPNSKSSSVLLMNLSNTQRILDLSQIIDNLDRILYYRSLIAPLNARINEKDSNGNKTRPSDITVNNPLASSIINYTLQPYEVLHIAIGVNDELIID